MELSEEEAKLLANRIEEIVTKQESFFTYSEKIESLAQSYSSKLLNNLSHKTLDDKETTSVPDYHTIDIQSVTHEKARTIGTEHLLLETAKQLQISEKLKELELTDNQIKVALANIIARASFPSSERGTKKLEKVIERVGRIKEKHRSISSCYKIEVIPSEDGLRAQEIKWKLLEDKFESKLTGSYNLRSNLIEKNAKELWELYHTMQVVETAFRFMKSSLGMRPVYHQKEKRVDGHLWITVLAYSLIQDILYRFSSKGINYHWESIRNSMSNRIRVTSSAQTQDQKQVYVRGTTKAEQAHLRIYEALDMPSTILKNKKVII